MNIQCHIPTVQQELPPCHLGTSRIIPLPITHQATRLEAWFRYPHGAPRLQMLPYRPCFPCCNSQAGKARVLTSPVSGHCCGFICNWSHQVVIDFPTTWITVRTANPNRQPGLACTAQGAHLEKPIDTLIAPMFAREYSLIRSVRTVRVRITKSIATASWSSPAARSNKAGAYDIAGTV